MFGVPQQRFQEARAIMPDKKRIIKVAAYIVVEIDADAYESEYGKSESVAQLREDIKWTMFNAAIVSAKLGV